MRWGRKGFDKNGTVAEWEACWDITEIPVNGGGGEFVP